MALFYLYFDIFIINNRFKKVAIFEYSNYINIDMTRN